MDIYFAENVGEFSALSLTQLVQISHSTLLIKKYILKMAEVFSRKVIKLTGILVESIKARWVELIMFSRKLMDVRRLCPGAINGGRYSVLGDP